MVSSMVMRTSILTTRPSDFMTADITPPRAAPRMMLCMVVSPTNPVFRCLAPVPSRLPSSITHVPAPHRLLNMRLQYRVPTNTKRLTHTLSTLVIPTACRVLPLLPIAKALLIEMPSTLVSCLETIVLPPISTRGRRAPWLCNARHLPKPHVLLAVSRATDRPLPLPFVAPDSLLQCIVAEDRMAPFPSTAVTFLCRVSPALDLLVMTRLQRTSLLNRWPFTRLTEDRMVRLVASRDIVLYMLKTATNTCAPHWKTPWVAIPRAKPRWPYSGGKRLKRTPEFPVGGPGSSRSVGPLCSLPDVVSYVGMMVSTYVSVNVVTAT